MSRDSSGRFLPGAGGRVVGSRNKLHGDVFDRLLKHWQDVGHTAIDIVFKENTRDYLKIVASILPKEHIVNSAGVTDMSDGELAELREAIAKIKDARESVAGNA